MDLINRSIVILVEDFLSKYQNRRRFRLIFPCCGTILYKEWKITYLLAEALNTLSRRDGQERRITGVVFADLDFIDSPGEINPTVQARVGHTQFLKSYFEIPDYLKREPLHPEEAVLMVSYGYQTMLYLGKNPSMADAIQKQVEELQRFYQWMSSLCTYDYIWYTFPMAPDEGTFSLAWDRELQTRQLQESVFNQYDNLMRSLDKMQNKSLSPEHYYWHGIMMPLHKN